MWIQENERLKTELDELRGKLEEAVTDSALFALQQANNVMKNRYLKFEKKVEQQQSILNQSAARMHELEEQVTCGQSEIKELKERLCMGMEQYKEKVIECLKLQESCQKRKKEKRNDEGNATDEENGMITRLQLQMQEVAAELDCRSARLTEMEECLTKEMQLRKAAEDRAREMEYELNFVKNELARKTAALPAMAEPIVPLPPPLQPQRIYPDIAPANHVTDEVDSASGESVTRVDPQSADCRCAGPPDSAIGSASVPHSLGEILPKCPLCDFAFPPQTSAEFRTAHIDMHYVGEFCPMCSEKFPRGSDMYAPHVQSHFDNGSS